jgi:hypothetical protein
MMYIRDLAAIVGLTLVVAGSLPLAASLKEKTLPNARYQPGHAPDPVGRQCCGGMLTERAASHTWALHEGSCAPTL